MWSFRSRSHEEETRYLERTRERLRGMSASTHVGSVDPQQVRARLASMNYRASRRSRPSECRG